MGITTVESPINRMEPGKHLAEAKPQTSPGARSNPCGGNATGVNAPKGSKTPNGSARADSKSCVGMNEAARRWFAERGL